MVVGQVIPPVGRISRDGHCSWHCDGIYRVEEFRKLI